MAQVAGRPQNNMRPITNLRRTRGHCAGALVVIALFFFATGLEAAWMQGRLDYNNGAPAGAEGRYRASISSSASERPEQLSARKGPRARSEQE